MVSSIKVQLKNWQTGNTCLSLVAVDDDEEVPARCVLHVSGDAKHSGDSVSFKQTWETIKRDPSIPLSHYSFHNGYYSKFTDRVKGKCSDASVTVTRSVVSLPLAVTSSSGVLVSFVKVVQCTNISQAFESLTPCESTITAHYSLNCAMQLGDQFSS